ncbi:MAG TPA: hypothetical protein DHW82_10470 [Spirochaetia bacterium]|nr:MAG: hypothetical protein A2Y41_00210 [Spirochaetes bacterium GWB1_36_13]HCL57416.1 hypothetical protein [Spirochaetia bacterium]
MDQENFEIINDQIKTFMSSYQENPFMIPLKRILSLHKRLVQTLIDIEDPVVKNILGKMDDAVQLILSGDESMLLDTAKDSYHTLLWKLHQYLLKSVFPK